MQNWGLVPAHSLGPHLSLWLPAMEEVLQVGAGKLANRINYCFCLNGKFVSDWLFKWLDMMAYACSPSTQEVKWEG